MEKHQDQKHTCKFCNKSYPCGRSLGGHMRSHLINISPTDHQKNDEKHPKKKLPPLFNGKSSGKSDLSMDQLSYGLGENPKKTSKFSKPRDEDALLQEKACKECGKSFQSWKALFGHMKCHSVNGRIITNNFDNEDSWNSCNKTIMDSQSDNEAATPLCRRKRSDRMKRYTNTATTNSSSLTIANFSPSVSEIDQHEQEEVALSLIILSRDKGDWCGINSVVESSDNMSPEFMEAKKIDSKSNGDHHCNLNMIKKLKEEGQSKTRKLDALNDEVVQIECNEFEVNSPRNLIKKSDHDHNQFERERKKNKSRKRKAANSELSNSQELEKSSKFTCSICKKAFASYQALGGHRASHKKFKGCCAPRSENSLETENSNNNQAEKSEVGCKKSKDHECPICFKVFPSGQALGGHKRSHLIVDQANNNNNVKPETEEKQPIRDIRDFLDLNLPAPAEEECNEFKTWWIGGAGRGQQRPLLGLLSS
ncbi:hypothetical protein C2S52_001580 [Perilla frutescens var. hirtella]|nr:hypothetical protein C2S52_001580 [Perilla frutescens var. hirtella]